MSNQVTREQIDSLRVAVGHYIEKGLMSDAEADAFVRELAQADLSEGEMNTILIDLGLMADVSTISTTQVKVEAWRNIILKLLLAGITINVIELITPGIYYTLYENILTSFKMLLNAGYGKEQIKNFIKNKVNDIPTPPMPRGIDLKSLFTSGFNKAVSTIFSCVNLACSLSQSIAQNIASFVSMENFNFISDFAVQTATISIVKKALEVLQGDYDREIADAIDAKVIEKYLSKTLTSIYEIKKNMAKELSESAVNISSSEVKINWNNVAPDRQLDISTTSILNNKLQEIINNLFIDKTSNSRILKIDLLKDIIEVLRDPNNEVAISRFQRKYVPVHFTQEEFRQLSIVLQLLTAQQATPDPGRQALSQQQPGEKSDFTSGIRSASFAGPFPVGDNPFRVNYETKNKNTKFDVIEEREALRLKGILPEEIVLGDHQKVTQEDDTPVNRFVYDVLIMPMDESRSGNIYTAIQQTFPADQDKIIDFIRGSQKSNNYDINYAEEVDDISEIIRNSIANRNLELLRIPKGGRRYRKSRRHKKRRTTRRRQYRAKGHRTRKGKKRRSTKRRH